MLLLLSLHVQVALASLATITNGFVQRHIVGCVRTWQSAVQLQARTRSQCSALLTLWQLVETHRLLLLSGRGIAHWRTAWLVVQYEAKLDAERGLRLGQQLEALNQATAEMEKHMQMKERCQLELEHASASKQWCLDQTRQAGAMGLRRARHQWRQHQCAAAIEGWKAATRLYKFILDHHVLSSQLLRLACGHIMADRMHHLLGRWHTGARSHTLGAKVLFRIEHGLLQEVVLIALGSWHRNLEESYHHTHQQEIRKSEVCSIQYVFMSLYYAPLRKRCVTLALFTLFAGVFSHSQVRVCACNLDVHSIGSCNR